MVFLCGLDCGHGLNGEGEDISPMTWRISVFIPSDSEGDVEFFCFLADGVSLSVWLALFLLSFVVSSAGSLSLKAVISAKVD